MGTNHPWPDLDEDGQWAIEGMERTLLESTRSPEEMLERAAELRAQAEQADIEAVRNTLLILAGRWEETAAARVASA